MRSANMFGFRGQTCPSAPIVISLPWRGGIKAPEHNIHANQISALPKQRLSACLPQSVVGAVFEKALYRKTAPTPRSGRKHASA